MIPLLLLAAALPALAAETHAPQAEPAKAAASMPPPEPPARDGKPVETAQALAGDLQRTLLFLELGKTYYKAFTSAPTHTSAENKAFLKFLEDYERESANAKKALAALETWLEKNADLAPAQ